MIRKNKISFIGLGKLGLPLATTFATGGVEVMGIDKNKTLINLLSNGELPFYEKGLRTNLNKANGKITYTHKYKEIIDDTDISIILVNTQIGQSYSSIYVKSAIKDVCQELKKSDKEYHLFVLSSTVLPGDIHNDFIPLIEKETGRKLNEGFGFSYVPDFVKLGSVIKDFENPDMVVIGASNEFSNTITKDLYSCIPKNNPPIFEQTLAEAEITKVSLNAFIVNKISFANFLSNLCEKVDNVNVDNITNAIGCDKRISPHFIKGGLSFGGTCFPRDTWAFIEFAKRHNMEAKQSIASDDINKEQDLNLLEIVNSFDKETVAVLGLSFKPDSPVIIDSASIKLIENLLVEGKKVTVYDPLCLEDVKGKFGNKISYTDSVEDCVKSSKLVVVALQYSEFKEINDNWKSFDEHIILDCWRFLDKSSYKDFTYKCLGEKII